MHRDWNVVVQGIINPSIGYKYPKCLHDGRRWEV